jgi:hypothetical protein
MMPRTRYLPPVLALLLALPLACQEVKTQEPQPEPSSTMATLSSAWVIRPGLEGR